MCSEGDDGSAAGSSSSSHRVSAMASVLADKMLESPEMVRWLEGDLSAPIKKPPSVTPKSVALFHSRYFLISFFIGPRVTSYS